MKRYPNKQGFSVVELVVAIVATAIVVMTVSLILFMPYRSLRTNMEYTRLRQDMSFAVRLMAKDIRASSYSAIAASEDVLSLPPNAVRPETIDYRRDAVTGVLTRFVDDVPQSPVITEGLLRFSPIATNDPVSGLRGVVLRLELADRDGGIAIVNETFVHTRN